MLRLKPRGRRVPLPNIDSLHPNSQPGITNPELAVLRISPALNHSGDSHSTRVLLTGTHHQHIRSLSPRNNIRASRVGLRVRYTKDDIIHRVTSEVSSGSR